jgi:kynureninase
MTTTLDTLPTHREGCAVLDAADPLASRRALFALPEGVIYLDGNSLGAMVASVAPRMRRAVESEWAHGLIRSWNDADWYEAPDRVGVRIAALIGAQADEVIACDSISVNLLKVLVGALRLRLGKTVILGEVDSFPTDLYVAQSVASLMGASMRAVAGEQLLTTLQSMDSTAGLAVVVLTEVNYKTGRVHDVARIVDAAHRLGALVVVDLAHSAGTLPVQLNATGVDFAVGCGYKYLNGGPGAPAFVFVAKRHVGALDQPIPGWHGHARPFDFSETFTPHAGVKRMLAGTAPQLSMIALEEALTAFDGVDLQALRHKGSRLGDLFLALVASRLAGHGFGLACPQDAALRGSQVSLTHEHGYAIMQALIARDVIGDFRAPNILRFGFAGLYVRYVDTWDAVEQLVQVMATHEWQHPAFMARKAVT